MKISPLGPLIALAACAFVTAAPARAADGTITPAFQYPIPNIPGKTVTALLVDYPPGAKTAPHRHGSAFVMAYVVSGAIRSQVDDGPVTVFHAGQSWSEQPHAHHRVSENASETEPAKLLAIFITSTKSKGDLVTFDKK